MDISDGKNIASQPAPAVLARLIVARMHPKVISLPLCLWSRSPSLLTGSVNQVVDRRWISLPLVESRKKSVLSFQWRRILKAQPITMGSRSRRAAVLMLIP